MMAGVVDRDNRIEVRNTKWRFVRAVLLLLRYCER
jgi:hypothetical protein